MNDTEDPPQLNTVDDLLPLLDELDLVVAHLRRVAERLKEEPDDA